MTAASVLCCRIKLFAASKMALIPGSYARAAGLQSEINKVTITRVAGSEVQFRRTIDTYQRDLRYNVNQIGREQRQLKRSMRRYRSKLRDSRKERKQRKAKVMEDAERLEHNARHFQQAERALKNNVLTLTQPTTSSPSNVIQDGVPEEVPDASSGTEVHDSAVPALSENSHSGIVGEVDETGGTSERPQHKVFLTVSKAKVPYLKSKRGPKDKTQTEAVSERHEESGEEQAAVLTAAGGADSLLPIISEEGDESVDHGEPTSPNAAARATGDDRRRRGDDRPTAADADPSRAESSGARPQALTRLSLDTKAVSATQSSRNSDDATAPADGTAAAESDPRGNGAVTLSSLAVAVTAGTRLRRRKGGVSYGDLIKLQHGSSTKRLFTLVDRLASKHGIVDLPPPAPASKASKASPLDPRSNSRIKRRGEWPESQMSDGMVRQAAVLYSMKYGYRVTDDAFSDNDVTLPVFLPFDISEHPTEEKEGEEFLRDNDVTERDRADGRLSTMSRKLSMSVRRDSTDVTSPYYTFSEAASSLFWDEVESNGLTHSLDTHERRATRSKSRQPLSMSQLSEQVRKVRERSVLAADSQSLSVTTDSSTAQQPSPSPLHTRSTSRPRRDGVSSQLHKRLHEHAQSGAMAWHSAFGRLKLLHTLYDLSQHFNKAGD